MTGDGWSPNLFRVAGAVFLALAAGTVVRLCTLRSAEKEVARARLESLKTWWGIALIVAAAALLGRIPTAILFAVISGVALREFARLSSRDPLDPRLYRAASLLIPLNYLWIALGWSLLFLTFLPVAGFILLSGFSIVSGRTEGFTGRVARAYWGMLLTTYLPAHAVLLLVLPAEANPSAGPVGLFFFLILLTEWNDIAQALTGRQFGKHRVTPDVSPNKTGEGLLGGIAATALLAVAVAPWLTPFHWGEALLAGTLISLAGFFGDLNMSAVKRDAGVKDAGHLLPGQGGLLDRIDSLTLTAPVFYYLLLGLA